MLLGLGPRLGVILAGKEDNGGNNIGVVWDEFLVEVCESQERVNSLYGRGGFPVLDG